MFLTTLLLSCLFSIAPPLRIAPELSGSFAELRSGHFHGGIDYRTKQKIGALVQSIDSGYIFRIGISKRFYGKVLYIEHPHLQKQSVYAHLSEFSPKLDSLVRKHSDSIKSNEFDWYLSTKIPVSPEEMIAYSGNSGSSGGPHLHFEIRDINGLYQINPAILGLGVSDSIPPELNQLSLYHLSKKGRIQAYQELMPLDTGYVSGISGFGISAIDYMHSSPFRFGLYRLAFYVNDSLISSYQLDSIPIENSKYIEAHIDYALYKKKKIRYERSFKLAASLYSPYQNLNALQGFYDFSMAKDSVFKLSVVASDVQSNTSVQIFYLKSLPHFALPKEKENIPKKRCISPEKGYHFENKSYSLYIPPYALAEKTYFNYAKKAAICSEKLFNTPLFKPIEIGIPLKADKDKKCLEKYLIFAQDELGKQKALKSTYKNGKIYAKSDFFATFVILLDTIAPQRKNDILSSERLVLVSDNRVSFEVEDNLSGLSSYEVWIDEQWVPAYYDLKEKKIECQLPETVISPYLLLKLRDQVGNQSEYNLKMIR